MTALAVQSPPARQSARAAAAIAQAEALLFGAGPGAIVLAIPRGTGKANVCATSDAAKRLYPGTGVSAVTRANPFMPYPELNGGVCAVYSHASPSQIRGSSRLDFSRCTLSFETRDGRQVIHVAPQSPVCADRFALSECLYRLALYIEGYRGALQLPGDRLFQGTAHGFWAGQTQFVGPLATLTPTRLSLRCPDLESMYYRDDFADQARRRCFPD